jgi:hypothetical protein
MRLSPRMAAAGQSGSIVASFVGAVADAALVVGANAGSMPIASTFQPMDHRLGAGVMGRVLEVAAAAASGLVEIPECHTIRSDQPNGSVVCLSLALTAI